MNEGELEMPFSPSLSHPIALTIGTFDGVHRGHQALLRRLKEVAGSEGMAICLAFRNHPAELLQMAPPPLLTSPEQKSQLIREHGAHLLLLSFTAEIANQEAGSFLAFVRQKIPFSHLILGHDARLGRKRHGTPALIHEIASQLGFELEYLPPVQEGGHPISSSRIRDALMSGQLDKAERLLGRPFAFISRTSKGSGKGREIGFPTLNLDISHYPLPPFGVYTCMLQCAGIDHPAIANLGVAPTLQENRRPLLEVHLLSPAGELDDQEVSVTLRHFLRPEQKFETPQALIAQITADVRQAKGLLGL